MLERVGEFRDTDYSVRFLMNNLVDFFSDKSNWKAGERPYVLAMLKLAAMHPDKFRRNAYTFNGVRFNQHEKDKKGKVVSCMAYFGEYIPTEKDLERHRRKMEKYTTAPCTPSTAKGGAE